MTTVEDLTKTQIILLTLLISFITSIATGIITTSLLAQAPQGVTQTINQVVERTVEKVAPAATSTTPGSTVREVTVVSVDDAIQSASARGSQSVVRIMTPPDSAGNKSFYALGAVVTKSGYVLSDKRSLIADGNYTIIVSDGTAFPASLVATSDIANLALFQIHADEAHASKGFLPIGVSKNEARLGQTVVAMEGAERNGVGVGRITSVDANTSRDSTDISPANETQGGMLLNLSGELVGIKTSNDDETLPPGVYTTLIPITKLLSQAK